MENLIKIPLMTNCVFHLYFRSGGIFRLPPLAIHLLRFLYQPHANYVYELNTFALAGGCSKNLNITTEEEKLRMENKRIKTKQKKFVCRKR